MLVGPGEWCEEGMDDGMGSVEPTGAIEGGEHGAGAIELAGAGEGAEAGSGAVELNGAGEGGGGGAVKYKGVAVGEGVANTLMSSTTATKSYPPRFVSAYVPEVAPVKVIFLSTPSQIPYRASRTKAPSDGAEPFWERKGHRRECRRHRQGQNVFSLALVGQTPRMCKRSSDAAAVP